MNKITMGNTCNIALIESPNNCVIAGKLLRQAIRLNDSNPNAEPSQSHRWLSEISYLLNEGACDSAIIGYSDSEILLTVTHRKDELPVAIEIKKGFICFRNLNEGKEIYALKVKDNAFEQVLETAKKITKKLNELAEILNN